ncbi:PA2778 family cysteine peptidase [Hahella aquimaris]|uniref:PA2778 family cysteine peptidase n=1 Tax=Hahella sp. HNIBRBA332 TaxID=3015983 RepID=UPI00273B7A9C|nr:PA2778 family cysteine peptidase [Hahella sp. HNIBRBA332]WLQ11812.1 PA2778 family cysteine peptidase [Hahella sp. HNIBRBA332]
MLVIAAALSGCGSLPQSAALMTEPPSDIPPQAELTATPFYPQSEYQCGPAALATVLTTPERPVLPDDLVGLVYVPDRQGSFQVEMVAAARSYGRLAYPLQPEIEDILREVAAGHPVLVFQNLGLSWSPVWHFAVVVGYDFAGAEIILRSGVTERETLLLRTFERTWKNGGYWARVILPPGELPATGEPFPVAKAAQDLANTGHPQEARATYAAAVKRWPDSAILQLGLGNLAYAAKDYAVAEAAFRQLVALQPQKAEGWNNLSYALAQQGCHVATEAAKCASALAPDDVTIATTSQDVADILARKPAASCVIPKCPSL